MRVYIDPTESFRRCVSVLGSDMRGIAVVTGGLLLIGGAVLVAVADQQRVDALAEAKAAVVQVQETLDATRDANYALAEDLTALRSLVADQNAQLSDATGFLP